MAHFEKQLTTETKFKGRVFTVTVDTVELEDGETSVREIVHHSGGACVLPLFENGDTCLVRQFRYAFGQELWELPAGKLEPGEDPFEAAVRELGEECGLTAERFTNLGVILPTVGYDSEKIYIWAAAGLHQTAAHPDEGEFLTVQRIPLAEAYRMTMDGRITDAKTVVAVLKAQALLADGTITL
jgi:ADP-ribose pyrophosphatase